MTSAPKTIEPRAAPVQAAAIFEHHHFSALPVVRPDGGLVGILTKLDFLAAFAFRLASITPHHKEVMCCRLGE